MAGTTLRTDPLRNFKFQVSITRDINGVAAPLARAGFMSVSGLAATTEVIPYREGGMNTAPRKLPGQTDFPQIQLSRGLFSPAEDGATLGMWNWFKEIFFYSQGDGNNDGSIDFRTNFTVRLLAHPVTQGPGAGSVITNEVPESAVKAAWKVYNAWPTALSYSDLDAGGNAVSVNQMVLAHEGIELL